LKQVSFSILTAIWAALIWGGGCPTPLVGPAPAPTEGNSPSPSGASDSTVTDDPASPPAPMMAERSGPPPGGVPEATPTWTPSLAGSVVCSVSELFAKLSLSDRSTLTPTGVSMTVTVRDPETGEEGPLSDHHLQMRLRVRDPSTGLLVEVAPAAPTLDPSALSGFPGPTAPGLTGLTAPAASASPPPPPSAAKSLEVWIELSSTLVFRTVVGGEGEGPTCDEFWEQAQGKPLVVSGTYHRGKVVYSGRWPENVPLALPSEPPVILDPFVLSAPRR